MALVCLVEFCIFVFQFFKSWMNMGVMMVPFCFGL